jgi:hypothetical protein
MQMKNYPDENIAFMAPVPAEYIRLGQEFTIKWTPFKLDENKRVELWISGNGDTAAQIASSCTTLDLKNEETANCFDSEKGELKWVPRELEWSILRLIDHSSEPIKYKLKLVIGQYNGDGEILSLAPEKEILSSDFNLLESGGHAYLLETYKNELNNPNISISAPKKMEQIQGGSKYQLMADDNAVTFGICTKLMQGNRLIKSYYCKDGIFGSKNIQASVSFPSIDIPANIKPGKYSIELSTKKYCDQYVGKLNDKIDVMCFPERRGSVDVQIVK